MQWLILSLVAPLFWAVVVLIDDNLLQSLETTPRLAAIISGAVTGLPALLLLAPGLKVPSTAVVLAAVVAGALTTLFFYMYFRALEHEAPSVVSAQMSLAVVLIPFLAAIFLHEHLHALQYVGILLVAVCAIGISMIGAEGFKPTKAFWLMSAAAVLYASIEILTKFVYTGTQFLAAYGFVGVGLWIAALGLAIAGRKDGGAATLRNLPLKIAGFLALGEGLNLLGEVANNLAISSGPVSLVKAIMEGAQPIYVLLFAVALYRFYPKQFREASHGHIRLKLSYMAAMVVGLYLIAV